ncbi:hypothetical protein EVAR_97571_1 [Eumeta japonica]|uniref:Uncharacterized protein n=1 Tax=Eumeta variegata TaxID=151549 RepID=A0A4C1WNM3_EUMVA|nr:hypothetical protein EVAR_97571_1 [Eumeta japonica]
MASEINLELNKTAASETHIQTLALEQLRAVITFFDSDSVSTLDHSPVFNFGPSPAFDSDPGPVFDSGIRPAFNFDSAIHHSYNLNKIRGFLCKYNKSARFPGSAQAGGIVNVSRTTRATPAALCVRSDKSVLKSGPKTEPGSGTRITIENWTMTAIEVTEKSANREDEELFIVHGSETGGAFE